MASSGKQKGSAFERNVCKDLSLWITKGKHKDIFWRSAMSGGRSTVALKSGDTLAAQSGDISSIHSLGFKLTELFLIECKFYKNLEFAGLVNYRGKLATFWQRTIVDAINYSKQPMLIAKQNHYPSVIVLDQAGKNSFRLKFKSFDIVVPSLDMHIMTFDRFKQLNPRLLRKK